MTCVRRTQAAARHQPCAPRPCACFHASAPLVGPDESGVFTTALHAHVVTESSSRTAGRTMSRPAAIRPRPRVERVSAPLRRSLAGSVPCAAQGRGAPCLRNGALRTRASSFTWPDQVLQFSSHLSSLRRHCFSRDLGVRSAPGYSKCGHWLRGRGRDRASSAEKLCRCTVGRSTEARRE